ncbi:hydroxyacylglutathione hydrolase [Hahella ganghwensis]|uniref:hydroxyacylglutathione hydrolase n=1 Tax=Hahella ganghwensis TaxID=286420 RepID=UPI00036571BD|nr:hydroxyacylglutathione hydrolase [Hahella ganghwensis]
MTKIFPIPAFHDNYIWLYQHHQQAWVVDPGEASPVETALLEHNLELNGILVTHHHMDHVGGIRSLLATRDIPVYGYSRANIPLINHPLDDGAELSLPGLKLSVMTVPGHTMDHIAYFGHSDSLGPVLFCGDTLFSAGCGRLFEGTPSNMLHSLAKLKALPGDTRVYCAHEYTLSNLAFAKAVLPKSEAVQHRINECTDLRHKGHPTVPSLMSGELAYNPFLRTDDPEVISQARNRLGHEPEDEAEVMGAIRKWKDNF